MFEAIVVAVVSVFQHEVFDDTGVRFIFDLRSHHDSGRFKQCGFQSKQLRDEITTSRFVQSSRKRHKYPSPTRFLLQN